MSSVTIFFAALTLVDTASQSATQVTIDGGSSWPSEQHMSYSFTCPDGIFVIEIAQRENTPPFVVKVAYGSRSISALTSGAINNVLGRLRALESITPRCLTHGGLQVLISGLERGRVPSHRLLVGITIDKKGRVSVQ